MTCIDKSLIIMRISYNTDNEECLQKALRDLVHYGCTLEEMYENCTSREMKLKIRDTLIGMRLKPISIK